MRCTCGSSSSRSRAAGSPTVAGPSRRRRRRDRIGRTQRAGRQGQLAPDARGRVGQRVEQQPQPGVVDVALDAVVAAAGLDRPLQLADPRPQPAQLGLVRGLRRGERGPRSRAPSARACSRVLFGGAQLGGAGPQHVAQPGGLLGRGRAGGRRGGLVQRAPARLRLRSQLGELGAQPGDLLGGGVTPGPVLGPLRGRPRRRRRPAVRTGQVGDHRGVDRIGRRRSASCRATARPAAGAASIDRLGDPRRGTPRRRPARPTARPRRAGSAWPG